MLNVLHETLPLAEAAILLREGDEVAVARRPLAAGTVIGLPEGGEIRLAEPVPPGHKLALQDVPEGAEVRKYGQVIGHARRPIHAGEWVHTQNLGFGGLKLEYEFGTEVRPVPPPEEPRTFRGYARADGRAGTRNYVGVIATVNCSASTVRRIAAAFPEAEVKRDFPNVDGVFAVAHTGGCGVQLGGKDYAQLQRTLGGMADHPNTGAYLIVGLGCETNQALAMIQKEGLIAPGSLLGGRPQMPPVVTIQESGGIARSIQRGIEGVRRLLAIANETRRTEQPVGKLTVGLNCGGSDGHSGITANPALGLAGDELVRHGAGWVLAETTETYGAEHLLTKRAVSREVGEKLLSLMRWWEWYTGIFGAEIDNNPSPGNKEGGLTTIYEKSLGAAMKGGSTPLRAVYNFAERVTEGGFTFMDTPGLDPVSVTGLVAGGCNLVTFTTGRGSCLGFKPAPVLKISTNTPLYERMPDDMDLDAGVILNGVPMADVAAQIVEELLAVASGKQTKSEAQGLGEDEFAPWIMGPVL
jgi:altronate hydrolase